MTEQKPTNEDLRVEPILLHNNRITAEVTPKGAFVNSLTIDGHEIIYPRTEKNPKRGGIPVLGPTPGQIVGSDWEHLYPNMPQHGKDREELWEIKESSETRIVFDRILGPEEFLFHGRLTIVIELLDNGLRISKSITNFEEKPREIGSALHPYFTVDGIVSVSPDQIANLYPPEAGKAKIIQPGISVVTLQKDSGTYKIESNPTPTSTLVWTDKPDRYICIEPWSAEVGKGDIIGPVETKTYSMTITKD